MIFTDKPGRRQRSPFSGRGGEFLPSR